MNPRSLRFKLTVWYAGLLLLVVAAFGAYTYHAVREHLTGLTKQTLLRRAIQIASALSSKPEADSQMRGEMEATYAPALNDRFIRVTRDGEVIYVSGKPNDGSFVPDAVPRADFSAASAREEPIPSGGRLLVAGAPIHMGTHRVLVEVGSSESATDTVLRGLLIALSIGLPVLLAVAIIGGYVLVTSALAPVEHIAAAAHDITLHHLDRRLPVVGSGDEIQGLSETLNQMISRLDESFQSSSRFSSDASHELRTPLTIMRGELEALLMDETLPRNVHETLYSLLEEIQRLVKIVEGLFALSRLDIGEAQMERVRCDLAQLVRATADQMCLLAEVKDTKLLYETGDRVDVEGDRARLKQVVVNLLDNAIKFTPCGGTITVSVAAESGMGRLRVADSGPGIPEEALPHVFDRFFRADGVRSRDVEGAGLGLSIVKSICGAHGGSAVAENSPGGGCSVCVEIPLAAGIN